MDTQKLSHRLLTSVAFSLVAMAVVFISNIYMEVKTGYRFVLLPLGYAKIFAVNAFLIFVLQVMTAGIKYEFGRRLELQPIHVVSGVLRVLLIGVAWFVILLAMGVWIKFISLGRSALFHMTVMESAFFSVIKIWNFGR